MCRVGARHVLGRVQVGNRSLTGRLCDCKWRDPDPKPATARHQRHDSAEAFLEKFYARPPSGVFPTVDARSTTTRVDYRVADYSFALAGSFEPSMQAGEIPLVLSLSRLMNGVGPWFTILPSSPLD